MIFQELEFNGVMRFYYQAQDLASGQKVILFEPEAEHLINLNPVAEPSKTGSN